MLRKLEKIVIVNNLIFSLMLLGFVLLYGLIGAAIVLTILNYPWYVGVTVAYLALCK